MYGIFCSDVFYTDGSIDALYIYPINNIGIVLDLIYKRVLCVDSNGLILNDIEKIIRDTMYGDINKSITSNIKWFESNMEDFSKLEKSLCYYLIYG